MQTAVAETYHQFGSNPQLFAFFIYRDNASYPTKILTQNSVAAWVETGYIEDNRQH